MRVRARAELGPVRRSLCLDSTGRSDHRDREPTVKRRPDAPTSDAAGPAAPNSDARWGSSRHRP